MPGFVYIIRMVQATANALPAPPALIKVGRTDDPQQRPYTLNTGNPYRLEYVAGWRVTDAIRGERAAHASLNGLRAQPDYGGGREWFRLPVGGLPMAQHLIQQALAQHHLLA